MPVIDGVKVACPPCIRGHRSTKCTHQAERIMVAVRKPGRPLSSCPHQKGKPCTCNNITAAIPRNAQCGCGNGPSAPTTATTKDVVKTEPPAPDVTPRSPMSPTKSASFRIQKSTATKLTSHKQSYDILHLSQMDPNTINLVSKQNLPSDMNGNISYTGSVPSPNFLSNMQPAFNCGGALGPQFQYAKMPGSSNGTALDLFFENPHGPVSDLPSRGISTSETLTHSSLAAMDTPQYAPAPKSLSPGSRTNGGCCAKNTAAIKPTPEPLEQHNQRQNVMGMMRYGNPLPPHNASVPALEFDTAISDTTTMHHHTQQQSTPYAFPIQYGSSFYEPLQFSQWQEIMASQSPGILPQNTYMAPHSEIEASAAAPSPYATNQCFCGEGCQCLGCSTHPFNSAMQEYVLSALQDEHSLSPRSDGDSNGVSNVTSEMSSNMVASPGADASPVSDTGTTGINDYLFVAYCPGNSQTCPCGDECACVGCMIHGDTAAGTPVTPP
ncbi:hypothetical protein GGS21DRAFT_35220 [Xylaria nigripes]|nr:hypothetical protein GGS21DRAFT_35220 [Xylaria nigripes]